MPRSRSPRDPRIGCAAIRRHCPPAHPPPRRAARCPARAPVCPAHRAPAADRAPSSQPPDRASLPPPLPLRLRSPPRYIGESPAGSRNRRAASPPPCPARWSCARLSTCPDPGNSHSRPADSLRFPMLRLPVSRTAGGRLRSQRDAHPPRCA